MAEVMEMTRCFEGVTQKGVTPHFEDFMRPPFFPRAAGAVAGLAFAVNKGSSLAADPMPEVQVEKSVSTGTVMWNFAIDATNVAWSAMVLDGTGYICGACSSTKATRPNREGLRKSWIKADGKKVLRSLSIFNTEGVAADLSKARARCKPVNVANPKARFAIGLDPKRARL
ncbi:hypothetical protein ACN2XU_13335 [Primorskyibacter sp. 2E107]|uniref:hypothetical protein n=1 Tax=Primorskyibacter sp. 2E107 TaxID=3403458 RepID=UPI003AF55FB3